MNSALVQSRRQLLRTRDGSLFDADEDLWTYRDNSINVSLNFAHLNCDGRFREAAKSVLSWYAENKSGSHLKNLFERLQHFLRAFPDPISRIDGAMLLSYRASLSKKRAWYFGTLSGLLLKWQALGYKGVEDDVVPLLKTTRKVGNQKGEAVLTLDSQNGPLTDIEVMAVGEALVAAREDGRIEESEYLLAQLFVLLGQRAIQYAALKVGDLKLIKASDGTTSYMLRIPRAKQRDVPSRHTFKDRLLAPQIGAPLHRHCARLRSEFALDFADEDDIPIFPSRALRKKTPHEFRLHRTSGSLADTFIRVMRKLEVISERTGAALHITPTRFRRTVGTRAAMEGHGELVIAELLDHNDTQNVGVYAQAVPQIIERIDRAVAMHLAPLAQAFAGVLIEGEFQAIRSDDPSSRIVGPHIDPAMRPMGSCGRHGFCGLMAPIACYTCRSFQPWRDGPHEAVLQFLLDERERLVGHADVRIASVNDRTILAVAEVVRLCAARPSNGSAIDG
ncbi:MAG: site-specific integrase [Hyphomicrobiaceae bacterium]|nr:site-specific integrase [Hyphomicrobiaceae bacterium]